MFSQKQNIHQLDIHIHSYSSSTEKVNGPTSSEQLFSSRFSTGMNVTVVCSGQLSSVFIGCCRLCCCDRQTLLPSLWGCLHSFQRSVVVLHKFSRWGCRILRPLHHMCVVCAACFLWCLFFKLHASISLCVQLRADSHAWVEGVVCFDGGVRVCAVLVVAACHGDSEGVCVLQLHLVLLRHFNEGAPSKRVTEASTKPADREENCFFALSFGMEELSGREYAFYLWFRQQ